MRRGFFISLVFHAAITIIAYLGFPYLNPEPLIADSPIFVDIVKIAEESNSPPPQQVPEPEIQKAQELPVLPPEPLAESEPKIMAEEKLKVAVLRPEPKPKPKPTVKPEPRPRTKLSGIRPPRKPRPPDAFASVLRTLEALDKAKPKQTLKPLKDRKTDFEEAIAVALKSNAKQNYNPNLPVSMSETDAIRKHFQRCWNVPAGAKGAEGMVVELEIRFLQDGSVRSVKVLNSARMRMDSFFKITAEAAQRAVLHPKCNKLSMPPDKYPNWQSKYQKWQKMTLVFNPKDMF